VYLRRRGFIPSGLETAFASSAVPSNTFKVSSNTFKLLMPPLLQTNDADEVQRTIALTLSQKPSGYVANVAAAWWLSHVGPALRVCLQC
jgi:hypothetical protein